MAAPATPANSMSSPFGAATEHAFWHLDAPNARPISTRRPAHHALNQRGEWRHAKRNTCCCCLPGGGLPSLAGVLGGVDADEKGSLSLLQAAAYGATMFGSAAMNNIWVTYYIAFFSQRVQGQWFYFGQGLYMLWNAVNDPLVGWISDAAPGTTQRRTPAIRYGGPVWALVFALAWIDLPSSPVLAGIHFTLILCAYDGLLTYVEVNHGALLADLSSSISDRTRLNQASALGAILGSFSSFFGHLYWDGRGSGCDLTNFRRFAGCVSVLAALGFAWSAAFVTTDRHSLAEGQADESVLLIAGGNAEVAGATTGKSGLGEGRGKPKRKSALLVLKQLTRQRNLALFTAVSALQVFECTFEKNFLYIFVDVLLADLSKQIRSMIISVSFVLPWLITFLIGPFVTRFGVYRVIGTAFVLKVGLSGMALCIGHRHAVFVGVFAVATRVLTECVCRQTPIILADLVDEDQVLNRRDKKMSGVIIGSSAFFTKPGESLAPMLGWYLLHGSSSPGWGGTGGEEEPAAGLSGGQLSASDGLSGLGAGGMVNKNSLFTVLVLGPLIIASLQVCTRCLWAVMTCFISLFPCNHSGLHRSGYLHANYINACLRTCLHASLHARMNASKHPCAHTVQAHAQTRTHAHTRAHTQVLLWSRYHLHGSTLEKIKSQIAEDDSVEARNRDLEHTA